MVYYLVGTEVDTGPGFDLDGWGAATGGEH